MASLSVEVGLCCTLPDSCTRNIKECAFDAATAVLIRCDNSGSDCTATVCEVHISLRCLPYSVGQVLRRVCVVIYQPPEQGTSRTAH